MERIIDNGKLMRMNFVESKVARIADAAKPAIALVGGSVRDIDVLEAVVLEQGFRLFDQDGGADTATIAPDLVVMDVAPHEAAGQIEERLRACRSRWQVPILCLLPLTEHLQPQAIARLSADDYLLKPVRQLELGSRIRVALQRWAETGSAPAIERRNRSRRKDDRRAAETPSGAGVCMIDEPSKTVVLEGRELDLTPKEYELMRLLAANPGRTFSAQEIIAGLWQDQQRASASDVHQCVHMLRRKIESDPAQPCWIITVRGFGYKLVMPGAA